MRASTALRAAAACAVACGAAAPSVRRRLGLRPRTVAALAWQAPVALVVLVPRSRARDACVYALQMRAYVAGYQMPGDDAAALERRLWVRGPIVADRRLGLGETPTVRLQRLLGAPQPPGGGSAQVRRHDIVLSAVHWLWYLVPHGTVGYVLLRHPERFPGAAARMAAVFDLGLVVYWALPTAPPWWAGGRGEMPHVRRIMTEAGEHVWHEWWNPLYDSIGGNPFAAMPSLHYATSHAAARILSDIGPLPGRIAWGYTAALGFALVYLGEHYVVDLVAGLALAEVVRAGAPRLEPAARAAAAAIERLEPAGRLG